MPLVVQKFGGSSVATAERIMAAARRAIRARQAGNQVIVVVSARGDTTDELIELAREITEQPPSREMDMLLSTGEQISIALMAMAIQTLGQPAISFTGAQIGIVTDSFHTKARIKNISTQRLRQALDDGNTVIVAGFQGIDEHYNITTLGRGGSDTTAVALAAVMKHDHGHRPSAVGFRPEDAGQPKADSRKPIAESRPSTAEVGCEIYTDVDGIYTTDPRLVPEARKIPAISYDEMLELASVGAGVMHSRSIEFAKKFHVPLQVRSSFSDIEGTWIVPENTWMRSVPVCGAAIVRDEARVSIVGVPDQPGISHRIFAAIADKNIVVDMIVQNVGSLGKADIGFTVLKNELPATLALLRPLAAELGSTVSHEENVSKVSIVGVGMRTHTGVAERMFMALANENVNIKMITTSEIKISVLVDKADGTRALRAVHQAFGLHEARPNGASSHALEGGEQVVTTEALTPTPGTEGREIMASLAAMEDIVVSDVELDTSQGRITIFRAPDRPGICSRIFQAIAQAGIVVDMIVQNLTDEGRGQLSFSVPRGDLPKALAITRETMRAVDPTSAVADDADMARIHVSGVGMRTHTGVARRMFGALAQRGINISMISTSEIRVGVVVDLGRGPEALEALKAAFNIS